MTSAADTSIERRRATLIGSGAVLLWGTLAVLTTATGDIPPFQLVALSFAVAFLLTLAKWIVRGDPVARYFLQPRAAWMLGVGGLFGFHFLLFVALKTAPPAQANLVNYLWPLLIVLFSAFLPGERLRPHHVVGAAVAFAGAAVLIAGGSAKAFETAHLAGYAAALGSASIWAGYSLASSRLYGVPTDAVGAFCLGTAFLSAVCHLTMESFVQPTFGQWLVILALGAGPVGGAFFLWDWGVKRGNIRALAALAYSAPLISTVLLILFGRTEATLLVLLACLLIVGGAALAAGDILRPRRTKSST